LLLFLLLSHYLSISPLLPYVLSLSVSLFVFFERFPNSLFLSSYAAPFPFMSPSVPFFIFSCSPPFSVSFLFFSSVFPSQQFLAWLLG
jgi:hypothetical protein